MSLTREQKKDLDQLSHYFKRIEKIATEKNIDLDVYMSEYREEGYAFYATEKVSLGEKANSRKKVFEKAGKETNPRIKSS